VREKYEKGTKGGEMKINLEKRKNEQGKEEKGQGRVVEGRRQKERREGEGRIKEDAERRKRKN
jgi:hypothetical protein